MALLRVLNPFPLPRCESPSESLLWRNFAHAIHHPEFSLDVISTSYPLYDSFIIDLPLIVADEEFGAGRNTAFVKASHCAVFCCYLLNSEALEDTPDFFVVVEGH